MDAQAKEMKNKVMCEINSFAIVYFFTFLMLDCSLQQSLYERKYNSRFQTKFGKTDKFYLVRWTINGLINYLSMTCWIFNLST
jgi:hypothetical protein